MYNDHFDYIYHSRHCTIYTHLMASIHFTAFTRSSSLNFTTKRRMSYLAELVDRPVPKCEQSFDLVYCVK